MVPLKQNADTEQVIPFTVVVIVLLTGFATLSALGAGSHAILRLLIAFALMILTSALIAWPFLRRPRL